MNTKKCFKQSFFVVVFAFFACLSFSTNVLAADPAYGVSVGSDGSFSASIGSSAGAICANNGTCGGYGGGWMQRFSANEFGLPSGGSGGILGILSNILFWLLSLFAIFGIIGFVLSGIWYLLSAGEEGMADKGKEGMKWSIVGIIVGLSGYIIMQAVASLLGGNSTTF